MPKYLFVTGGLVGLLLVSLIGTSANVVLATPESRLPSDYSPQKLALQFLLHFQVPIAIDMDTDTPPALRRWSRPPTVGFTALGEVSDDAKTAVYDAALKASKTLEEQTGHVTQIGAADQADGDVLVVVTGQDVSGPDALRHGLQIHDAASGIDPRIYERAEEIHDLPSLCAVVFLSSPPTAEPGVYRGVIVVDGDLPDGLVPCLLEELAHVVGLISDVQLDAPTQVDLGSPFDTLFERYAEPKDRRTTLSASDIVVLQTLRRPEFTDQMPDQEAVE